MTELQVPEEVPEHSLGTKAARGTLWLGLGAWISKGMQMIILIVVARVLAPKDLGVLAAATLTVSILQVINEVGITDALTYRGDDAPEAARTALTIMLFTGAAATVLAWLVAPTLAVFFHTPHATGIIRGFATVMILDAAATVPIAMLERDLRFSRRLLPDAIPAVVGGATTVLLLLAGHGLAGLVAGSIVQGVLIAVVAWAVGFRCRPGWNPRIARELVGYGISITGASVLLLLLLNVDYIIVGRELGPSRLGFYSLAFRICYLPYISVTYVINGAAFPFYCRLPSGDDLGRAVPAVTRAIACLTAPMFAGLALMAPSIVLLGTRWAPSGGAVRWLAVYGMLLGLTQTAQVALKAIGRPHLLLASRAVQLVALTVVLLVTAKRGIGVVAIDQAVVVAAVAVLAWVWVATHSSVTLQAIARSLLAPALGVGAMVLVVIGCRQLRPLADPASWLALIVTAGLALLAYAAVILSIEPGELRRGWALVRGRGEAAVEA